jgi:hypothetical protein
MRARIDTTWEARASHLESPQLNCGRALDGFRPLEPIAFSLLRKLRSVAKQVRINAVDTFNLLCSYAKVSFGLCGALRAGPLCSYVLDPVAVALP